MTTDGVFTVIASIFVIKATYSVPDAHERRLDAARTAAKSVGGKRLDEHLGAPCFRSSLFSAALGSQAVAQHSAAAIVRILDSVRVSAAEWKWPQAPHLRDILVIHPDGFQSRVRVTGFE
jgi:hypothetical protein